MFKKHLAALILLLGLSAFTSGQEQASWQRFDSAEGKFHVLVPGKPEVKVQEVDSAVGKLTLYTYGTSNEIAYFLASYGDYPEEPTDKTQIDAVLDKVRNGVIKSLKAELISEKAMPLSGWTGREFIAKGTEGATADTIYNWKMVLVGRRLYQLGVVTTKSNSETPDIMKFFRSFEVN